jgi:FkbM family methyltransferase
MISFAQNFEDVMLRRVFPERRDGFYMDVGAMDPVLESVTKFFYDEGWSGVNIEPNQLFYDKLVRERPRDINLSVALGEHKGERPLYVFGEYGISTFDQGHRDRFVERGFSYKEEPVQITTLAAVCAEHVRRPIDFLKVDCEGWEKFVLRGADWERFRPTVLLVEATEPLSTVPSWDDWEPFLLGTAGYHFVYFDGINRFYIPKERPELRACFDHPPNVLDEFQTYSEVRAKARLAELEQQTAAQQSQFEQRQSQFEEKTAAQQTELESLRTRLAELEDLAHRQTSEIDASRKYVNHLEEELAKMRLWVGRLSQELAAKQKLSGGL